MTTTPLRRTSTWRVADIVVASVIAVASGVVFWGWNASYGFVSLAFVAFPPASAFVSGMWLFPAVLGALIIRKPGAALYCELLAAVISALLGSQWGIAVLISGLVQGLGAEVIFAALRYRLWNLPAAMLAGTFAGLFGAVTEAYILAYFVEYTAGMKIFHVVAMSLSGLVIAGILSFVATRALARTGALSALPSRRANLEPVFGTVRP
ncbi:ECF transporter S component [Glutamicibacter sp. MNS18]|uniref:ECF transporter S component n=1 Tax=Glutamicibacter sp. MNS18 TaxID=2989817 RepID=UPI0022356C11|nr:ECF transporter S component [Glutamicibacter sp. MNS18]MCW4463959.1 ECF transporter S component [Glutamicibacter sp. MNS18]